MVGLPLNYLQINITTMLFTPGFATTLVPSFSHLDRIYLGKENIKQCIGYL
jgi:hypothetical protein